VNADGAALEGFREVHALAAGELRPLLDDPDPPLRVWSAWALGLRLGADVVPLLRERLDVEPRAGIRRHFVRMLAGFGAFEMLERLEHADPDAGVREDAAWFRQRCTTPNPSLESWPSKEDYRARNAGGPPYR